MVCKICASSSADLVNADLVRGQSVRDTAAKYGFSRSGTDRHARRCLPKGLAPYSVPQQTLADQVAGLWAEAARLKLEAERSGDLRCAMVGLRQLCDLLELRMRATPPALRSQKEVRVTVKYEEPRARNPLEPLSDAELVAQLGHLVRRTKSEAVMATAAKLALLLKGRPVPMELEAIETSVLPQLPAPEGER